MSAPQVDLADRRLTPATERVALASLRGRIERPDYTEGVRRRVVVPVADLDRAPDGPRDRQILRGAAVLEIETRAGRAFVQSEADGYCGWVDAAALGPADPAPTHRVCVPATHLYPAADFKQRETGSLSLGARVAVAAWEGKFARLADGGFVPAQHLDAAPAADPVEVALSLLGTPYLWGGNSRAGIDCSGLVQISLHAAGRACPGDSDLQSRFFAQTDQITRGDLLFWPGHVAMAISGEEMVHATAFAMSVIRENIADAIARIEAAGDGPYLGARRP